MKAMVLNQPQSPLVLTDVPVPEPAPGEVRIQVSCCGMCRTDLHVVDGDLKEPKLPIIPGHQIVGVVDKLGEGVHRFQVGDKVGVPWLGRSCGQCEYCKNNQENLCDEAGYTGYQINGGFAQYCCANEGFCFPIPEGYPDIQVAPLLCAGLIGYRSLCKAGDGKRLGFYGFGAAAHILVQVARYQGREVYAFTRPGDQEARDFALKLGVRWADNADEYPQEPLDAAIIFAPVGDLVPKALKAVKKGGRVICAGIHMSDIPSFPYEILWGERRLESVANLTRHDGEVFLKLAPQIPVKTEVTAYTLSEANQALSDLRDGRLVGAGVIVVSDSQ